MIDDIEVEFPYEPYPCQLAFMESVIKALKGSVNAILESPTGTGKTLCLLCSTIAFQQHYRAKEGQALKIYYSSRTHSQLSQVIRELKSTAYSDTVRTTVLGSRDQLCVNSIVNGFRGSVLNASCRSLLHRSACHYAEKLDRDGSTLSEGTSCLDIEDFKHAGLNRGFCPFFQSRENEKFSDLIFLPYNYIVDPHSISSSSSDKGILTDLGKNSIVIIDEAHNIERVCEESASIVFGQYDIACSVKEIDKALLLTGGEFTQRVNGDERRAERSDLKEFEDKLVKLDKLKNSLKNLDFLLTRIELTQCDSSGKKERAVSGTDLIEMARSSGLSVDPTALVQAVDFAQEIVSRDVNGGDVTDASYGTTSLQNVRDFIGLLATVQTGTDLDNFFRVFVQLGDPRLGGDDAAKHRIISLFCLSASVAMRALTEGKRT